MYIGQAQFKGLYNTIKIGALVQIWFWYKADIEFSVLRQSCVALSILFEFKVIITGQGHAPDSTPAILYLKSTPNGTKILPETEIVSLAQKGEEIISCPVSKACFPLIITSPSEEASSEGSQGGTCLATPAVKGSGSRFTFREESSWIFLRWSEKLSYNWKWENLKFKSKRLSTEHIQQWIIRLFWK